MKKTLLVIAAMIVALPALAKMPSIDVGGEIRVRGEEINNTDFLNTAANGLNDDKDSHVNTMIRVNLNAELSDGVGAYLCFDHPDESWTDERANIAGLENTLGFRHAYITIDDVAGLVDLTLGRQGFGVNNNELVLQRDAIDAKKASAKFGNLSLTGLCAKDIENGPTDNDTDIQGLNGSIKLDVLSGINVAGYGYRSINRNPNKDLLTKTNVYGGKVSGSLDIASVLNYSVEYAIQKGTNTGMDTNANAYRVVLGYTTDVEGLGALAIEGSYLKMSGEDGSTTDKSELYTGIDPNIDYYTALVDQTDDVLVGANGLKAINVNAQVTPEAIDNITLGISYTKFDSARKLNPALKTDLGSELDLTANYKYSDTTSFGFTYARFTPGDAQDEALGAGPQKDTATMLRAELLTKF